MVVGKARNDDMQNGDEVRVHPEAVVLKRRCAERRKKGQHAAADRGTRI
jgi:hypothetical protein